MHLYQQECFSAKKSFKLGMTEDGVNDLQSSEEMVDLAGKQSVCADVSRRALIITQTELDWGHSKSMNISKEGPTRENYG